MKDIEKSLDQIAEIGRRLAGEGGAFASSLLLAQLRRGSRRHTPAEEFLPGFLEDLYAFASWLAIQARNTQGSGDAAKIVSHVGQILDSLRPAGVEVLTGPEAPAAAHPRLPGLRLPGGTSIPAVDLAAPPPEPRVEDPDSKPRETVPRAAAPPREPLEGTEPPAAAQADLPGGKGEADVAGGGAEDDKEEGASPLAAAVFRLRESLQEAHLAAHLLAAATDSIEKEARELTPTSPREAVYRISLQVLQGLDHLRGEHELHPAAAEIAARMEPVLAVCLASLEGSGVLLVPGTLLPSVQDLEQALSRNPEAFETRAIPGGAAPNGTPLFLLRRALVREGSQGAVARKGEIAVSGGPGAPLAKTLLTLLRALEAGPAPEKPAAAGGPAAIPKALLTRTLAVWTKARRELLGKLLAADERGEATIGRFVVNDLDRLREAAHKEGFGFSPAVHKGLQEVLKRLEKLDVFEVSVRVGDRFDERYSPGKFERRTVRSAEPVGQIVGFLQRSFVTRMGLPLQKGIVLVSGEA